MSKIPEIDEALEEINACEDLLRPYEYSRPAARVLQGLTRLRELLERPSAAAVDEALDMIRRGEKAVEPYRHMGPVEELLKHAAKLREHLTEAKKKL